jgi:hypothetical protein
LTDVCCARCGFHDTMMQGYGFGEVGFYLCRKCSNKWYELIRVEHRKHIGIANVSNRTKWHDYANKLLIDFVFPENAKEIVQFT